MPDLPEHRERYVREYVDGQIRDDADKVTIVQQVGTRRILGRVYEMFDVHCEQSRWWVITDPTNLYVQDDFPEVEQAFIFHLGLGLFMAQRSRTEMDEDREEHVSGSWRRYQQAVDAMDSASEAADFQAVGIRCREALLALVHDHADAQWIGEVNPVPQRSNFKAWGNIFAERLARDELRAYTKALVDKTWGPRGVAPALRGCDTLGRRDRGGRHRRPSRGLRYALASSDERQSAAIDAVPTPWTRTSRWWRNQRTAWWNRPHVERASGDQIPRSRVSPRSAPATSRRIWQGPQMAPRIGFTGERRRGISLTLVMTVTPDP